MTAMPMSCPKPVSQPTIQRLALVVEDDRRMRAAMIDMLRSLGYHTLEAASGFEAIRLAAQFRPALVVIDGLLPNMHGLEVSRFIRNSDSSYAPRVIIVTGIYRNIRYRNEARLKYGIEDYLVKPITREALVTALGEEAQS
jgi:CheY-like chemotaxis protein